MDLMEKALAKLLPKERDLTKVLIVRAVENNLAGLDIKKLRGWNDVFRIRKGDVRIVYRRTKDGRVNILAIERRSDTTYRDF